MRAMKRACADMQDHVRVRAAAARDAVHDVSPKSFARVAVMGATRVDFVLPVLPVLQGLVSARRAMRDAPDRAFAWTRSICSVCELMIVFAATKVKAARRGFRAAVRHGRAAGTGAEKAPKRCRGGAE